MSGRQTLFMKGQMVHIFGFAGTWSLLQLLTSSVAAWKQPLTIHKWMWVAVFQYNFISKNRWGEETGWKAGFGLWASLQTPELDNLKICPAVKYWVSPFHIPISFPQTPLFRAYVCHLTIRRQFFPRGVTRVVIAGLYKLLHSRIYPGLHAL